MLSYKMKNYALLDYEGKLTIKGSGLRSRGLEKIQRVFLRELIFLLLKGEESEIPVLYEQFLSKIDRHEFDITYLCKTEAISESLGSYQQKVKDRKRHASALYELALQAEKEYQPGDQISYYVTGTKKNVKVFENCKLASQWDPAHPDENVPYYKAKLEDLYKKFKPFLPNHQSEARQLELGQE